MNYAYTSARVRALENRLLGADTVEQLISCSELKECIRILNSCGIVGDSAEEILANAAKDKADITNQLIDDVKDIEVIFYEKTFHNLKAAIKKLYTQSDVHSIYFSESLLDGEFIEKCIVDGRFDMLPQNMSRAAEEAYKTLLRTGDGQLSDIIIDKACLDAMLAFAKDVKHEILKKYVYETVAVADIKTAMRLGREDRERALSAMAECPYFRTEALLRAAEGRKSLEEFLKGSGFADIDLDNIDRWSRERITRILKSEKYNIFTPAPAINFILALESQLNLIRLILVCKAGGIDESFIRSKAVI